MSVYRPPTKPVKGDRWPECPVTGLRYPEREMIFSRGRFVHPIAYDQPGYREYIFDDAAPPLAPRSDSGPIYEIIGF